MAFIHRNGAKFCACSGIPNFILANAEETTRMISQEIPTIVKGHIEKKIMFCLMHEYV